MVIYKGGSEVIICTEENEKEMRKQYFMHGGRDIDEYDRDQTTGVCPFVVVEVNTNISVE